MDMYQVGCSRTVAAIITTQQYTAIYRIVAETPVSTPVLLLNIMSIMPNEL